MTTARKQMPTASEKSRVPAAERQRIIAGKLAKAGFMSIAELGADMGVSEMTIRRDLNTLASQGSLVRAHGGAICFVGDKIRRVDLVEPVLDDRIQSNSAAKAQIGQTAARLVSPGQTIAIDIGSTTLCLAHALMDLDVRVFTNSLKIALLLSTGKPRVYLPGGEIRGSEPSIIGSIAQRQLETFHFDWAFIGASSIGGDGIYDYSLEDTEIKQSLIARCNKRVALMDSSKFNSMSVVKICDLQTLDMIITDRRPTGQLGAQLAAAQVDVLHDDDAPQHKETA